MCLISTWTNHGFHVENVVVVSVLHPVGALTGAESSWPPADGAL